MLCCGKSLQSCPALGTVINYCPPGSSIHGILQAKILEWAAVPLSRKVFHDLIEIQNKI